MWERKASLLMLTPPPVQPVVIVAAWFTDIICTAKSSPLMHSAADAEVRSLLPSADLNIQLLHPEY